MVDYDAIDVETWNKIKILEQVKQQAVNRENYEQAQIIKGYMERLRGIGQHLMQLEEKKQQASQVEDYDGAKIIKVEIAKLKKAANNPEMEDLIQAFLLEQNPNYRAK